MLLYYYINTLLDLIDMRFKCLSPPSNGHYGRREVPIVSAREQCWQVPQNPDFEIQDCSGRGHVAD